MIDRRAIRAALVERIETAVTSAAWFSPTFMDFEQVPVKPALTLAMDSETRTIRPGAPSVVELHLVATLHIASGSGANLTDDVAADMIEQLEAGLARKADETSLVAHTTLGGTVAGVYISGDIQFLSAGREGQTVVDIPITVETLAGTST